MQVARALLERIDAWEPRINAMYRVQREARSSRRAPRRRAGAAGRPLSPLDGVPLTIKENIYTRGDPAPIGTRANEDAPPQPADAPPAARVREAGCVILGKTTMPDFGMLSSGLSSLHGITRNPWRLDRNPSGSSSGAGRRRGRRATRRCTSAPTSAARCGCRPRIAASSRSSLRSAACRCTRPISAASPGR